MMKLGSLSAMSGNQLDGATHQLRNLVDDAERFLGSAVDTGDQKLDALREDFAKQVKKMRSQLDEFESEAFHRLRRTMHNADRTVHEHPYAAMGAVAALGILFAVLAARR